MASVLVYWAACFAFVQLGRRNSITISAAAAKVGVGGLWRAAIASRFSASGSRPSLIVLELARAALRASARETLGYPPRPTFRREPSMVTRWNQYLVAESSTRRLRPPPSEYVPLFEPTERKPRKGHCACVWGSSNLVLPIPVLYHYFTGCGGIIVDVAGHQNSRFLLTLGRKRPMVRDI